MPKRPFLVKLTVIAGVFAALITLFRIVAGDSFVVSQYRFVYTGYLTGLFFSRTSIFLLLKELFTLFLAGLFAFGAIYMFKSMKKRAAYILIFASFALIVHKALVLLIEPYFFTLFDLVSIFPYSATLVLSLISLGKLEPKIA